MNVGPSLGDASDGREDEGLQGIASQRNSAESALRGSVGVWQGCAWRVRFKTNPTGPVVMLWIKSLWDLFDLEGKLKDP